MFARAIGFIDRHPLPFCFAFRFLYGFRIAGPLAIGVSDVPARTFAIVNFVSAAVWATVFTLIGYRFEPVLGRVLAWVTQVGPVPLVLVAAGIVTIIAIFYACRKKEVRTKLTLSHEASLD